MLKYVVAVFFLFCCSILQAEMPDTKVRQLETIDVALRFGTGMIAFRDLYLPRTNTDIFVPHLRADGNIREADSMRHYGIAVECGLDVHYHLERYLLGYYLGYRRAGSLGFKGLPSDSSYANTFTGVKGFYTRLAKIMPGIGVTVQRVAFSNLSHAHTVMSLLPTAEVHVPLRDDMNFSAFFGYALWNRLGYATKVQFLGAKFQHTQVKAWTAGISAHKQLNHNSRMVFTALRENIDIHLDDVKTYTTFGLTLRNYPNKPTPQDIPLHTSTVSLSIQRDF